MNKIVNFVNDATDAETTDTEGLSYNLRIGTSAGGNEVFSSMSSTNAANNGYRYTASRGCIVSDSSAPTSSWRLDAFDEVLVSTIC